MTGSCGCPEEPAGKGCSTITQKMKGRRNSWCPVILVGHFNSSLRWRTHGRGLNTHISGVKADIILCTSLLLTSIILRDCFEGCEWGTFSERPSAAALEVCSQVFMRCKVSYYSLQPLSCLSWGRGILSKPQRKILVYGFLWLEKCTCNWPIPSFGLDRLSRKAMLPNTALRGFYTEHANTGLKCFGGFQRQSHNLGKNNWLTPSSVLRLYYSCYKNKLFRTCPKQMPVFGGIDGHHFPPIHQVLNTAIKPTSQRCELIYFQ